jgi:hypothetical protein
MALRAMALREAADGDRLDGGGGGAGGGRVDDTEAKLPVQQGSM